MIERILPDLYRIEVPLPHNPLRAVNSYVIRSRDRNLIIDTGFNLRECLDAMMSGLNGLGVDLGRTDFFITHMHADHLDLVSSLATNSSVVCLNRLDVEFVKSRGQWENRMHDSAQSAGFPENELQEVIETYSGRDYDKWGFQDFTPLGDDDAISIDEFQFRCVETPGHSKGHMCLYESEKRILISGDHILGQISPNISLWNYDWNPLDEYLKSLDKVNKLDVKLVLPGHRDHFRNCSARIQELKDHHEVRAKEILSVLKRGSMDAFQTASLMTWDMKFGSWDLVPSQQKLFATTEALSHLKYLEERGLVRKEMDGQKMIFSIS